MLHEGLTSFHFYLIYIPLLFVLCILDEDASYAISVCTQLSRIIYVANHQKILELN